MSGRLRWFLSVPAFLYRHGFARTMESRVLLLTTTGRRSGQRRTVGLNYTVDGDSLYVLSGFGHSGWYSNVLADPHVEVQLGPKRWSAVARRVTDPRELGRLQTLLRRRDPSQGPPRILLPIFRFFGYDYDREVERLEGPVLELPVIAISRTAAA